MELKERYLKGVRIVKDSKSDSAIIGHMYEVSYMQHWLYGSVQATVPAHHYSGYVSISACAPLYFLRATCLRMPKS